MTTRHKLYPKTPVVEALIDLQVARAEAFSAYSLLESFEHINGEFPNREEIHSGQFDVAMKESSLEVENQQNQHVGYRFTSKDKRKVLNVQVDRFTFSHLAPYKQWESLRDEARELWNMYCAKSGVTEVSRFAVRYINRFDIPYTHVDLSEYLRSVPEVSPAYSQSSVSNFFMQLQIPQTDIDSYLILNEAPVIPSPTDGFSSFILDLDLFSTRAHPLQDVSDDSIWEFLDSLNSRSYEIFEASITDKARELIR